MTVLKDYRAVCQHPSVSHPHTAAVPLLLGSEQLSWTHWGIKIDTAVTDRGLVILLTTGEYLQHCFYMHSSYLA